MGTFHRKTFKQHNKHTLHPIEERASDMCHSATCTYKFQTVCVCVCSCRCKCTDRYHCQHYYLEDDIFVPYAVNGGSNGKCSQKRVEKTCCLLIFIHLEWKIIKRNWNWSGRIPMLSRRQDAIAKHTMKIFLLWRMPLLITVALERRNLTWTVNTLNMFNSETTQKMDHKVRCGRRSKNSEINFEKKMMEKRKTCCSLCGSRVPEIASWIENLFVVVGSWLLVIIAILGANLPARNISCAHCECNKKMKKKKKKKQTFVYFVKTRRIRRFIFGISHSHGICCFSAFFCQISRLLCARFPFQWAVLHWDHAEGLQLATLT